MKIGMSLSGGGSQGSYTVGALSPLVELPHIKPTVIYGTSTGALISLLFGLYAATKDKDYLHSLESIYSNVTTKDILAPRYKWLYKLFGKYGTLIGSIIFGGKNIYDLSPLESILYTHMGPTEWDILIDAAHRSTDPVEVGFCCVNLQNGTSKVFSTFTHPDIDTLRTAVLASSAQPVLMPPYKIEQYQYIDGGVLDYTPANFLFKSELFPSLDRLFVYALRDQISIRPAEFKNIMDIFGRTIEILVDRTFASDLHEAVLINMLIKVKETLNKSDWDVVELSLPEEIRIIAKKLEDKKYIPIHVMRPREPINTNALEFKPSEMRSLIKRGKIESSKILASLNLGDDSTNV